MVSLDDDRCVVKFSSDIITNLPLGCIQLDNESSIKSLVDDTQQRTKQMRLRSTKTMATRYDCFEKLKQNFDLSEREQKLDERL